MKVFFDTSVLVAATVAAHPAHARSVPWLQRAVGGDIALVVCTHILAEMYAVLTRIPSSPRVTPTAARRLIDENIGNGTVVELEAGDYRQVIESLVHLGLSGGVIYDALMVRAAQKAEVDRLLTLNEGHFRRVWPGAGALIATP